MFWTLRYSHSRVRAFLIYRLKGVAVEGSWLSGSLVLLPPEHAVLTVFQKGGQQRLVIIQLGLPGHGLSVCLDMGQEA